MGSLARWWALIALGALVIGGCIRAGFDPAVAGTADLGVSSIEGGTGNDTAPVCMSSSDCPKGVACVDDVCVGGVCRRVPHDERCAAEQQCDPAAGCVPRSMYARTVLGDGPLAYWRLGEPPGATMARDATGHGWDLTIEGSVTLGQPGAIVSDPDTATSVPFTSGRLFHNGFPDVTVGLSPYTFEAWVRWLGYPGPGHYQYVVGRRGSATGGSGQLFFQQQKLKLQRYFPDSVPESDRWPRTEVDAGKLPTERYVHVVGTFDGSTQRLYIDGVEVGSMAWDAPLPPATTEFVLAQHLDGDLDEVAVYDYALSPSQVARHHTMGVGIGP